MPTGENHRRIIYALVASNSLSLAFLGLRSFETRDLWFIFLIWNLFLAWVPLLFAWWLAQRLRTSGWLNWQNILLSVAWLAFLPNSFYIVTDFIHIGALGDTLHDRVMDVVMITSFTFSAYTAGLLSLFLIHKELIRRLAWRWAHALVGVVLLASGFAIYLGRTLRWNSWDVLANPLGLLFDVSHMFINIGNYPDMVVTTAGFALLVGSMYAVVWQLFRGEVKS